MKNYIKLQDVVQIESNPFFPALVGSQGVVKQVLAGKQVLVSFASQRRNVDPKNLKEVFEATDWILPFQYLRVLESPYDTRLGVLEEEILGLEADLVTARCCLSMSEELREQQYEQIKKLNEDIDNLKAEIYHLRDINN